jgi:uncharacterized protein YceK
MGKQMKKYISMIIMALGTMLFFSGCGTKTISCEVTEGMSNVKNGRVFLVIGEETWRSPSAGYNVGTRNLHILQNAADTTLDRGFKYFAFIRPGGVISNKEGSLINTAEGFIKACVPSALNPFTVGSNGCGWGREASFGKAIIEVFTDQPLEITTYDAQIVKDYMIAHKLWREVGVEEKLETCSLKDMGY